MKIITATVWILAFAAYDGYKYGYSSNVAPMMFNSKIDCEAVNRAAGNGGTCVKATVVLDARK